MLLHIAASAVGQQPDLSTILRSLQARRLPNALLAIESALRSNSHNARLLLLRAKILDELGRSSESVATYRELLLMYPGVLLIGRISPNPGALLKLPAATLSSRSARASFNVF